MIKTAFAVAVVGSLMAPAGADSAPPGLCTSAETTYFACPTTAGRVIALCGAGGRSLQYRFGRPDRIELRYPPTAGDSASRFRHAQYARHQVERVEVAFSNEGVDYAVFDYTEGRKRRAGVRVTGTSGKEHELACARPAQSRLAELKGVVPCDTDSALNGGSCR